MQSLFARLAGHRPGDTDRAFRLGKLGASVLTGGLVCSAAVVILNAESLFRTRLDGARLPLSALATAALLLTLGLGLRVARNLRREPPRVARGLLAGALHGVSREVEIASGFVASVLGGVAVAGNADVSKAIGGWVVTVVGLSSTASVVVTICVVAAAGTVLTDLARGGILRALRDS